MMYPSRRVFFVKIWMTEVTSDDDDDSDERVVYCRGFSSRNYSDVQNHDIKSLCEDLNNNVETRLTLSEIEGSDYEFSEGYETLDNDELMTSGYVSRTFYINFSLNVVPSLL